jgi:hypothetical protein
MSLHFMHGINLRLMTPQTMLAMAVANDCFAEAGEDCLVTSVCRTGAFLEVGYHGSGNAIDVAVRRVDGSQMDEALVTGVIRRIRTRIGREGGGQYDVVDERAPASSAGWTGAHIHIEYDPK